eukprot:6202368-Pleurochrysis_carterae.AAC.1
MAMPSGGWAGAMALSTVGSVHISTSSQQSSVHAECALAKGGMTPNLARRIGRVVVVVTVIVLGEDVEGRVEAEEVAIVIGVEHAGNVELLGLELETCESLVLELGLVAKRSLVLHIAMSARKAGREPLLLPRSLRKRT